MKVFALLLCLLGIATAQYSYPAPSVQRGGGRNGGPFGAVNGGFVGGPGGGPGGAFGEESSGGEIPGEAGKDYPVYAEVPQTSFSCQSQRHIGYYADPDASCQVFHICQDEGRQDSFLCPNGTIFNQQYFVCDWWFNFECSTASQFYDLNALIGQTNGGSSGGPFGPGAAGGVRGGGPSGAGGGRGGPGGPSGAGPFGPGTGGGRVVGPSGGPGTAGGGGQRPGGRPGSTYLPPTRGGPGTFQGVQPGSGPAQSPNNRYLPPNQ